MDNTAVAASRLSGLCFALCSARVSARVSAGVSSSSASASGLLVGLVRLRLRLRRHAGGAVVRPAVGVCAGGRGVNLLMLRRGHTRLLPLPLPLLRTRARALPRAAPPFSAFSTSARRVVSAAAAPPPPPPPPSEALVVEEHNSNNNDDEAVDWDYDRVDVPTTGVEVPRLEEVFATSDEEEAERAALVFLREWRTLTHPDNNPFAHADGKLGRDLHPVLKRQGHVRIGKDGREVLEFETWVDALNGFFERLPYGSVCRRWRLNVRAVVYDLPPGPRIVTPRTPEAAARLLREPERPSDMFGLKEMRLVGEDGFDVALPLFHWRDPVAFGDGVTWVPLWAIDRFQLRMAIIHWAAEILEVRFRDTIETPRMPGNIPDVVVKRYKLTTRWMKALKRVRWPANGPFPTLLMFTGPTLVTDTDKKHAQVVEFLHDEERMRRDAAFSIKPFRTRLRAALAEFAPDIAADFDAKLSPESACAFIEKFEEDFFASRTPDQLALSIEEHMFEDDARTLMAKLMRHAPDSPAFAPLPPGLEATRVRLLRKLQFRAQCEHELRMMRRIDGPIGESLTKKDFLELVHKVRRKFREEIHQREGLQAEADVATAAAAAARRVGEGEEEQKQE